MNKDKRPIEGIKNPLVLIALFASISEVAMTITLVQLSENIQKTFVWFVMIFPVILVIGFFFVLYRKPAVLFSPSDYNDEGMYLSSISNRENNTTVQKKIEQMEESIGILQSYLEKSTEDKDLKEELSADWKRIEALHKMDSNGLYSFLKNELSISTSEIINVIKSSKRIDDLPNIIFNVTNSTHKSDRMKSILNLFPSVFSDYENLEKLITGEI